MALKSLLAVVMCSAALVGCGSGSDGGPSVKYYSLDGFEGRSVGTTSIEGTWVMTGSTELNASSSSSQEANGKEAFKEMFVIFENEGSFFKLNCDGSYYSYVYISGNSANFSGITGSLTNNKQFNGSFTDQGYESGVSYSLQGQAEAVKISDSTNPIASLTISNSNGESDFENLGCIAFSNGYASGGGRTQEFEVILTDNIDLERHKGEENYTAIYNDIAGFYDYDTDYGDLVEFSIDDLSETSHVISFEASDSFRSMSGTINVNLPLQ